MDFHKEMQYLKEHNDTPLILALVRMAIFLAACMGDFELCVSFTLKWSEKLVKGVPGQGANIQVRFYSALSGLIMAQDGISSSSQRNKCKKLGLRNAKVIHSWMSKGNPNCVHMDVLLDAEKARLKKKYGVAMKQYEYAIVLTARRGLLHQQALASERYSSLLFWLDNAADGREHLKTAIKLYEEWGAFGKANMLETILNANQPKGDTFLQSHT